MQLNKIFLTPFILFAIAAQAQVGVQRQQYRDTIPGFEDPALLAKVMSGNIVFQEKISTKLEYRTVARAFFNKVSPEAYYKLATNHAKYPSMFPEIKDGKTLNVSADALQFDYRLHLIVKIGFLTQEAFPEGHQTVVPGLDATAEAKILNHLTNYQEDIKFAKQTTRLIPYQGGILVEDDIHFAMTKETAATSIMKKKLKEFFTSYVAGMRKELQGNF